MEFKIEQGRDSREDRGDSSGERLSWREGKGILSRIGHRTVQCETKQEATPEKTDEIQAVDGFYNGRERSLSRDGNRIVVRDIEQRRNSSLPGQSHQ